MEVGNRPPSVSQPIKKDTPKQKHSYIYQTKLFIMATTKSTSETGHAKNVANFKTMISNCTGYGALYNPANTNIIIKALNAKFSESDAAVKAVEPALTPYRDAINARIAAYEPMNDLVRSALSSLRASDGVPSTTLTDAATLVKKITGTNYKAPAPVKVPEPTPAQHSMSQQSFDMRLSHFNDFVSLLQNTPQYAPNETDITATALAASADAMQTANEAVASVYQTYEAALKARDISLYFAETGLVALSGKVKKYTASVSKLGATDKKLVSGLVFKTPAKNKLHF